MEVLASVIGTMLRARPPSSRHYSALTWSPHPASSALHGVGPLERRDVPSVIIDYDDDKENMPNESDYEDLPSMYKDEDDDVDEDDEDDEDDDSIFTSKQRLFFSAPFKD